MKKDTNIYKYMLDGILIFGLKIMLENMLFQQKSIIASVKIAPKGSKLYQKS